jgi:hypothetical protein
LGVPFTFLFGVKTILFDVSVFTSLNHSTHFSIPD